ncbi:hypothetical protein TEA_020175 [Camellia sinensis var. sinensis]|uniref:DNA topoisomerase 2 n=1 Tax=Camellia sinensis var. sinensis TaxID=542762 RepID=A0A4S4EVV1_CAMSN|nr:hypothetical protein TEA_020175 [Camellia sinensis var. sinensis]
MTLSLTSLFCDFQFAGSRVIEILRLLYSGALEVAVWRDGKPVSTLVCHELPDEPKDRQGTHIKFWPDKTTTRGLTFALCLSLDCKVTDSSLIQKPLHDIVGFRKEADGIRIDVAFQWCSDAYSHTMLGYTNSIRTIDGGTRIDGMKASLTRTLNNLGKKSKILKEKDISLSGEHVREGLTCVISVEVANPEFEGQTKTRLGNPEVRKVVDQSVQEYLTEYLELHPDVLDSILSESLNALKGEDFKKEALRYHKIIILTDADVDDAHIQTLLLTFFFRYQRALFDEGCIYVGVPPLYKVEREKQAYYCYDDTELKQLQSSFPSNASYNIQRFKGLGEMMPLQLWETTLDPEKRLLKQLMVEDAAEANVVFSSLMGSRACKSSM